MKTILSALVLACLTGGAGTQVLGLGVGVGMATGGGVSISVPLPQALNAAQARSQRRGVLAPLPGSGGVSPAQAGVGVEPPVQPATDDPSRTYPELIPPPRDRGEDGTAR